MKPGLFLTLEGGEGVGKSTNLTFIQTLLDERNIPHIHTREPGGTQLAEEIRTLLLSKDYEPLDAKAELLLVFAARAQHLAHVIKPALLRGDWVVCDRFTDATYAYQGAGRQLDVEMISVLEGLVQEGLQPDLTVLLDIDVKVGLERARGRAELDRFESESLDFFERVRQAYLQRATDDSQRFVVVDASQTLDGVQDSIKQQLTGRLDEWVASS